MKRIDELNRNECCGCTACYAVCPVQAISFKPDVKGFLYPTIDEEKCIHCGKCADVCVAAGYPGNDGYIVVYGAKHKDDKVRFNSSSGAAFTAFSDVVLAAGGVVYGCIYDENIIARHFRADNSVDRDRMRGSKYVQSDMGDTFSSVKKDLEDGRKVMFTGTPCQVAGLKSFLGRDYENLFTIDLVCHGVPSPKMFADHIEMLTKKYKKQVKSYNNRSKWGGWGVHMEQVFFIDGSTEYKSCFSQAYKGLFYSNRALRPSCFECKYANLQRQGDITICDMWGIEKALPEFQDKLGVSLVLVNSEKGLKWLEETKKDMEYRQPHNDGWIQRNMCGPTVRNTGVEEFWDFYLTNGYEKTIAKYCGCSMFGRFKMFVGNILEVFCLKNVVVAILRILHLHE